MALGQNPGHLIWDDCHTIVVFLEGLLGLLGVHFKDPVSF